MGDSFFFFKKGLTLGAATSLTGANLRVSARASAVRRRLQGDRANLLPVRSMLAAVSLCRREITTWEGPPI